MRIKEVVKKKKISIFRLSHKHQTNNEKYGQYTFPPLKNKSKLYVADIERRASLYKVPVPKVPAPYPQKSLTEQI